MSPSIFLRHRWKPISSPSRAVFAILRAMGGGPRTFPGGLNKWQFKRMHEKLAREKERKLLDQEKQIYQARLRSQIRAANAVVSSTSSPSSPSDYSPMTAAEQVKTLADRFVKQGAEDLWNEDDGPLKDDQLDRNLQNSTCIDLRKMVADRCKMSFSGSVMGRREFSTYLGKNYGQNLGFRAVGLSFPSDYSPMMTDDQVKTVADRFIKQRDEDLWNEDDSPLKDDRLDRNSRDLKSSSRIDLRKMVSDRCKMIFSGSFTGRREFSTVLGKNCKENIGFKGLEWQLSSSDYSPMTADDQVKTLVDCFVNRVAEDLSNEDDCPLKDDRLGQNSRNLRSSSRIDLRKMVSDQCKPSLSGSFTVKREFSTDSGKNCKQNFGFKASFSGSSSNFSPFMMRREFSTDSEKNYKQNLGLKASFYGLELNSGLFTMLREFSTIYGKNFKQNLRFKRVGGLAEQRAKGLAKEEDHFEQNLLNLRSLPAFHLRKMVADRCKDIFCSPSLNFASFMMRREFSTYSEKNNEQNLGFKSRRNVNFDSGKNTKKNIGYKSKWYMDSDSGSDSDCQLSRKESEFEGERKKLRLSSAALMKHDRKKERRVPRHVGEELCDVDEEVERIRDDLEKRKRDLAEPSCEETQEGSILTAHRFEELNISVLTVKALSCAGFEQMTAVQATSLPNCLDGNDILVKARTGTGKSIAFLIPTIEAVLKSDKDCLNKRLPPIISLVLCPTRELASQIAAEANVLLRHHHGIGVLSLIGGTRFKVDQQRLESDPCQIIVATPGRLLDHIENKSGFSLRLMGLKLLVLDEADHLLDLGFRKDIEKIVDCLPRQRQSLLFSATIPKEVRRISQVVLKKEHVFIDTVGMSGQDTPPKVSQNYVIAPHNLHLQTAYHFLKEHILQEADYKVIIFCTTSMVTELMYTVLRNLKMNVREMHSRKPQLSRTRISDEFKEGKRMILVTSDVSSRGINYPDVTLVIQMGVPCDREQYIHRLGRTGREGKGGKGIMLLAPFEEYFLDEIRDLPIENLPMPTLDPDESETMEESMKSVDNSIKEAAYHSWLGYYNSISETGRNKTNLVELANQFSSSMGLQCPPALFRRTVLKMGLKDIPGIRVRKS